VVRLTLEQGHSVTTMVAVLAVAIVLASVFYRRSYRHLPPSRWGTLLALRTVAIVLVVLLLFRPVLSMEREIVRRRSLVFLIDTSASMNTADDASGKSRFEQARVRMLDWLGKLNQDFDLHLIEFSDRATPLERPSDLARLQPTGKATSLTRGLLAAATKAPARDVAAVIMFSDGIHNAAGDPIPVARRLGLVVHTVGVGNSLRDSPSYRDVRVNGLECPEQLPVNNRAKITAHLGQAGLAGAVVKVALEDEGKQIDQADVELRDGEGPQDVSFQFVPTVKGRHTYNVRIPVVPGEKIAENNHRAAIVQVVDSHIRVLYLEGTLRAEYGALVQRFMSKDPDLEFCALVQTRPGVFLQRTNIEGFKLTGIPTDAAVLERFDVVLLGDLDSTYWKAGPLGLLVKRVREGAGLMMLGGYHSLGPGGYGGTALEDVLPVFVGGREIGQVTETFLPVLTPDGRAHPIFANIGKFFPGADTPPQSAGLPPLEGCVRVTGAKPGATVLAVYPGVGPGAKPMPVLAVQPFGKGRAAAFTADTTRNWQQAPRALDQESPFLRFWGQTVRWLANRNEQVQAEAGVVARTEKAYYEPDSPITVSATVRDKEGEGTDQAEVSAQVHGPQGGAETLALYPVPGSSGNYTGTLEPKRPGMVEIFVDARIGATVLHAEKVAAEVGRPNLEYDRLDLDDAMLQKIALAANGRYQHISTADHLIDELDRKEQRSRVVLEQPLYRPDLFWVLFVGLLAAEWVLRKRYQLR
jgi:uncharacterized membrane protein